MAKNTASIPTKTTGSTYTAAEFETFRGFVDSPAQSGTTFDDSGAIVIDGTVEYSTVRTVTGSTHTITAATSGNLSGNYKLARYTFDVDCNLTLTDFDTTGSTLGTVNPIPAGTYNFWFYATAFGVGLVIQNNTGTTPGTLSTPSIVLSAGNTTAGYIISAIDANATAGVLEFSTDNANWTTDEDYVFGVNTGTMAGLTNGVLYYVRFRVSATGYNPSGYATGTVTPSLAITQLTAPTANAPTVNSTTSITVTCNDPNTSPQESTMLFRRATNIGMTTGLTTVQVAAGTTSYQWTGLTQATTYYFDVIAQGNGSTTSDSDPSNVVSESTEDFIILFTDLFTDDGAPDSAKWTVNITDEDCQITQTGGKLRVNNSGTVTGFQNISSIGKMERVTGGKISVFRWGINLSSANRGAYTQIANAAGTNIIAVNNLGTSTLYLVIVKSGSTTTNENTGIAVGTGKAVKIITNGNGTVSFKHHNGTDWVQLGANESYSCNDDTYGVRYGTVGGVGYDEYDNLFATNLDYPELIPS